MELGNRAVVGSGAGGRIVFGAGRLVGFWLGGVYQVDGGLSLGGVELKVHHVLEQGALELDECGLVRINGGIRFELPKSLAEGFSGFAIRGDTAHEEESQ